MKKVVVLSAGIVVAFLLCLSISVVVKHFFGIGGDYLSAFSTLVAAGAAVLLYNDWRAPQLLNKIETEQRELRHSIRKLKRSADVFLLFMENRKPFSDRLNNGDQFSLEYQRNANDLLDNVDDIINLVTNYRFNFDENISTEKAHLAFIDDHLKNIKYVYDIVGKYNAISKYIDSYNHSRKEVNNGNFEDYARKILVDFPDGLSEFYKTLARK